MSSLSCYVQQADRTPAACSNNKSVSKPLISTSFLVYFRYSTRKGIFNRGTTNYDNYYSTDAPMKEKGTVPTAQNMYMSPDVTDMSDTTTFSDKVQVRQSFFIYSYRLPGIIEHGVVIITFTTTLVRQIILNFSEKNHECE